MTTTWPPVTSESRPWTRWWWLGSAVDKPTITQLLETYRAAGLGGVEVTSLYGVKGNDADNIDYLSPKWLDMVRHTIAEAKRLDMQVDLPPGSGWRIGGSFITDDTAAAELVVEGDTVKSKPSGEMVKRPGPGGDGRAFNPFSRKAIDAAAAHFTPAFKDLNFRAQFHDSWEYDSSACPELFDYFLKHRGYDLRDHAADLDATDGRVRYDVQRTLGEMAMQNFIEPWVAWCHSMGQLARNQAHGTPGNLVDFYAAVDIPETEFFNRITKDSVALSKFASSGAHLAGRRLVASETCTWMDEHYHGSLAEARRWLDHLFVAGINHNVYHGTAYSPPDAAWPGWVFYASTQFNPQNTIWRDFPALNQYVTRCQAILQAGEPDNDLLVYFPVHDVHQDPEHCIGVRLVIDGGWFRKLPACGAIRNLGQKGYSFDYVSDAWLTKLKSKPRAIVVPPCRYMPVETLERLAALQDEGVTVVFDDPPTDVPGFKDVEQRQQRFNELMSRFDKNAALDVTREPMADLDGVKFIRRKHDAGRHYFITNQGDADLDAWVELTTPFASVVWMDPMTGDIGSAQTRDGQVRLQLHRGESCILRTFEENVDAPPRAYRDVSGDAHLLNGEWHVTFIEGGPTLPEPFTCDALTSWTDRDEAFAGTARYTIKFDAPTDAQNWLLNLGDVRHSARIRLNGEDIATLIGPTYATPIALREKDNTLEIEVTNLAANRIRDLDRRGIEWRIFEDVNVIAKGYKPFDASAWPVVPSGLLGPVTLTALKA